MVVFASAPENPAIPSEVLSDYVDAGGQYTLQVFISDDRGASWSVDFDINGIGATLETIPAGTSAYVTATISLGTTETSFDLNVSSSNAFHILNAAVLAEVPSGDGSGPSAEDYVELPLGELNPFDGSTDFSVAAWFKTDGGGDVSPIISSSQPLSPGSATMAFQTGTATAGNTWDDGAIVDYAFSDQAADRRQIGVGAGQGVNVQDGNWRFGAILFDSATDTFTVSVYDGSGYQNNSAQITNPFGGALLSGIASHTVLVGALADGAALNAGAFSGQIDNLAIFSRELTVSDLDALRTGDFARFGLVESPPELSDLVETDLSAAMQNINATAYLRKEFTITDQETLDSYTGLSLDMRYDDGFVAYINGVEVARRNAPGAVGVAPAYNAAATADRTDQSPLTPDIIDLSENLSSLQVGTNILAIHGLNASAGNEDFLLLPQLSALSVDVGTFATPTPGSANSVFVVSTPQFVTPGKTFTDVLLVEIIASPEAEIHYTLDGTVPTVASPVYTGAISLSDSAQIRAIATRPGYQDSQLAGESYIALAADVQDFTSNIPLIILDNFGAGDVPPKGAPMDFFSMSVFEPQNDTGRSALTNMPDLSIRSGMRIRGQTSTNPLLPKQQFRLETWDQTNTDLVVSLLGLPADSSSDMLLVPELLVGTLAAEEGLQIYYTTDGTDPRAVGGGIAGTLYTGPITINEGQQITARSTTGARWSPPAGDYNDPANWRSSTLMGGSSGGADPVPLDGNFNTDFNGDGNVTRADVAVLLRNFGRTENGHRAIGDADHNGSVSLADLTLLQGTLGESIASTSAASALVIRVDDTIIRENAIRNAIFAGFDDISVRVLRTSVLRNRQTVFRRQRTLRMNRSVSTADEPIRDQTVEPASTGVITSVLRSRRRHYDYRN